MNYRGCILGTMKGLQFLFCITFGLIAIILEVLQDTVLRFKSLYFLQWLSIAGWLLLEKKKKKVDY